MDPGPGTSKGAQIVIQLVLDKQVPSLTLPRGDWEAEESQHCSHKSPGFSMPQLSHLWNGRAVAADNQELQWPSSSHVWMWEFDHKEGWVPKIDAFELWCWRRLLRVRCTAKRSNQSILKDQSWIFIGGTDAEAEAPILWPPDVKSQLIGKDPDGGKDRRQEEKGMIEDEMVGWHQWLNGREFEQVLGDG